MTSLLPSVRMTNQLGHIFGALSKILIQVLAFTEKSFRFLKGFLFVIDEWGPPGVLGTWGEGLGWIL